MKLKIERQKQGSEVIEKIKPVEILGRLEAIFNNKYGGADSTPTKRNK